MVFAVRLRWRFYKNHYKIAYEQSRGGKREPILIFSVPSSLQGRALVVSVSPSDLSQHDWNGGAQSWFLSLLALSYWGPGMMISILIVLASVHLQLMLKDYYCILLLLSFRMLIVNVNSNGNIPTPTTTLCSQALLKINALKRKDLWWQVYITAIKNTVMLSLMVHHLWCTERLARFILETWILNKPFMWSLYDRSNTNLNSTGIQEQRKSPIFTLMWPKQKAPWSIFSSTATLWLYFTLQPPFFANGWHCFNANQEVVTHWEFLNSFQKLIYRHSTWQPNRSGHSIGCDNVIKDTTLGTVCGAPSLRACMSIIYSASLLNFIIEQDSFIIVSIRERNVQLFETPFTAFCVKTSLTIYSCSITTQLTWLTLDRNGVTSYLNKVLSITCSWPTRLVQCYNEVSVTVISLNWTLLLLERCWARRKHAWWQDYKSHSIKARHTVWPTETQKHLHTTRINK